MKTTYRVFYKTIYAYWHDMRAKAFNVWAKDAEDADSQAIDILNDMFASGELFEYKIGK